MNTTRLTDRRLLALSIVLSGGIFTVDLALPLGLNITLAMPVLSLKLTA